MRVAFMPYDSLPQMFFAQAGRYGDQPRYRHKRDGVWREVSWSVCAERVHALTAAFVEAGLRPGDRVGLLSATRAEWVEADLAILSAGGVTVPIYQSSLASECGYILRNAGAAMVVAENETQAAKIADVTRNGFDLEGARHRVDVTHVFRIDGAGPDNLETLLERGRAAWPAHEAEIERRIAALRRDQLATIVYTSGTTGPPKGVMQTHGNHLAALEGVKELGFVHPGQVDFFFLPLAHSFARLIEYLGLYLGTVTAFAQSIDTLLQDMRDCRPDFFPSVPRVYEKIYSRVQSGRASAGPVRRALIDWALGVGRARSVRQQAGQPLPFSLAGQAALADRLVFAKIRQVLGGRVEFVVSGGAPLAREIAEFFHAAGVLVLEGYGLTETTPILTCNRPNAYKLGTVGLPISGVTLRIAADGEILAKGPNIALGYYQRPEATAEAWDEDGWFHTGDIGELDADGFLSITDRKKDLIKTSGGKYVAPQTIENFLKTQPHISQAILIGDNRKYCVALLTLDAEEIPRWAAQRGFTLPLRPEWPADPRIVALIEREVAAVNQHLASYEQVKYFRILPSDLTPESGELTPSLKVKRKVVAERHQSLIEEMYQ